MVFVGYYVKALYSMVDRGAKNVAIQRILMSERLESVKEVGGGLYKAKPHPGQITHISFPMA